MARKSNKEKLAKLLKKQEAIKNRIARIETKKRNENDRMMTCKKS